MDAIGSTTWVIMNARIPAEVHSEPGRLPRPPRRAETDTLLVLNTAVGETRLVVTVFPVGGGAHGPFEQTVPGECSTLLDVASLVTAAGVTGGFCAVVQADRPVVVEHLGTHGGSDGQVRSWSQLGFAATAVS